MAAKIIDGRAVAARVREQVARDAAELSADHGGKPGLATVLVGSDPASDVYVSGKQRASAEVGIAAFDHRLPADSSHEQVVELLSALNRDPTVDGILLQLPVPAHLDGAALTAMIDPAKDVDGLTPTNVGRLAQGRPGLRPCTPLGVIELLDAYEVALEGARAVVIGRSQLVGRPLAALLLERNATVTTCHSRTADLQAECSRADVLVAAIGRPRLVTAEFVKPGAAVIDVGITRGPEGVVGDVDFDAVSEKVGAITPVPGGVGPVTTMMLLEQTLDSAERLAAARMADDALDRYRPRPTESVSL
jgi:methylenetetrahydrofolate dehydrogenase (NADP+) / methenyltetrahydrofolate cyclohydrolase